MQLSSNAVDAFAVTASPLLPPYVRNQVLLVENAARSPLVASDGSPLPDTAALDLEVVSSGLKRVYPNLPFAEVVARTSKTLHNLFERQGFFTDLAHFQSQVATYLDVQLAPVVWDRSPTLLRVPSVRTDHPASRLSEALRSPSAPFGSGFGGFIVPRYAAEILDAPADGAVLNTEISPLDVLGVSELLWETALVLWDPSGPQLVQTFAGAIAAAQAIAA